MINTVYKFFFTPIQDNELFVAFKCSVKRAFILKKFFHIKNLGGLKEVTSNHGDLSSQHDISSSLNTINKGLPASVQVIELRFGDGVININGRDLEVAVLEHLVQVMHAGGGLLRQPLDAREMLGVLLVNKVSEVT